MLCVDLFPKKLFIDQPLSWCPRFAAGWCVSYGGRLGCKDREDAVLLTRFDGTGTRAKRRGRLIFHLRRRQKIRIRITLGADELQHIISSFVRKRSDREKREGEERSREREGLVGLPNCVALVKYGALVRIRREPRKKQWGLDPARTQYAHTSDTTARR